MNPRPTSGVVKCTFFWRKKRFVHGRPMFRQWQHPQPAALPAVCRQRPEFAAQYPGIPGLFQPGIPGPNAMPRKEDMDEDGETGIESLLGGRRRSVAAATAAHSAG
jgi:hypothetical protein